VGTAIRAAITWTLVAGSASGCLKPDLPTFEEVQKRFTSHRKEIALLQAMASADVADDGLLVVGEDVVGGSWKEPFSRVWSCVLCAGSKKGPREMALAASGLREGRYRRYLSALAALGAERITHTRAPFPRPRTELLLYSWGLVTSGCHVLLTNEALVEVDLHTRSGLRTIRRLSGGWFYRAECD
jgi:hypothetical protein